jgi:CRP/FNR family cyclic AMP-dependent transcriptional regulator
MEGNKLADLSLFEGLSGEDLETCAGLFQETEILAGSGLACEGDFAYKFFVVLEGEVEVQRNFEHVARLGPGDFFGEMGLVDGGKRNARVVADTRCQVGWVMAWDFATMTDKFPKIAERIETAVAQRSEGSADSR